MVQLHTLSKEKFKKCSPNRNLDRNGLFNAKEKILNEINISFISLLVNTASVLIFFRGPSVCRTAENDSVKTFYL